MTARVIPLPRKPDEMERLRQRLAEQVIAAAAMCEKPKESRP
jgi:hypothetical protein